MILHFLLACLLQTAVPTPGAISSSGYTIPAQDQQPVAIVMDFTTDKKGKRLDDESGTMTVTVAGNKLGNQILLDGQEVSVIFDNAARTITNVTTDKKGRRVAAIMPRMKIMDKAIESGITNVERTDETKQLLGYDTRKYIITSKQGITEAWLANVPEVSWQKMMSGMTGASAATMSRLMPEIEELPDALALAGTTTSSKGKKVTTMTVTAIHTGAEVNLDVLEIPSDAEVQDLTKIMGGF